MSRQDPFQVIQAETVIASGKKGGLKTLPVANANGGPGKQIADFRNLIAEGAQGILASIALGASPNPCGE